tara:strand:+ start:12 stop:122 length:111 start_codon:yes stop_codon:yes gene_type:complete
MEENFVKLENVTDYLVKFVLVAILTEKNLLKPKNHK